MSGTIVGLLVYLGVQADPSPLQAALAADDFHGAWALLEAAPDGLETFRARAELLAKAGDPARALEAAGAGLALDPEHLELLYYAAHAAVWLEDPGTAGEFSERLARAVETKDSIAPEARAAWKESAQALAVQSRALADRSRARDRAVARLRAIAIGGLAAVLALVGLVSRRALMRA